MTLDEFKASLIKENYFQSLSRSPLNIQARGGPNVPNVPNVALIEHYIANIRQPTVRERRLLESAIKIADSMLRALPVIHKIPWKILMSNDHIESGFPHTHVDYIIIPKTNVHALSTKRPHRLAETLVHEKIHVFQRLHPCECHTLYTRFWNLEIIGLRSRATNLQAANLRLNPDIDDILYKDPHTQKPIALELENVPHTQEHPASLSKTIGDPRDHPHEIMAYTITYILSNKSSYLHPMSFKFIQPTIQWISSHQ